MEYIGDWMLHDMAETGSTNDEVKKLSANIRGQKVVISARQPDQRSGTSRPRLGEPGRQPVFFARRGK